ncbi:MAG: hypothetical protein IKX70_02170 [Treponema sp.]|nr:hypothetical protein [Treponema sp.]
MYSDNHWETQPRKENGEFTFREKYNLWKEILKNIETKADKNKIDKNAKGGSYNELQKEVAGNKSIERHHMPAKSASNLSKGKGPCITMTREEHFNTGSHSYSTGSNVYRKIQKDLISKGRFLEAEIMDIIDVIKKTGEKYVKALSQKLDYDLKLYERGDING